MKLKYIWYRMRQFGFSAFMCLAPLREAKVIQGADCIYQIPKMLKKDGKKKVVTKKFLPGYIMVELNLPDLGWKDVCSKLRRIQGVTGFVGAGSNERPRPIRAEEAKNLLRKSGDIKGEKPVRMTQSYNVGEKVKIIGGSFNSFVGLIEEVNLEKNKLRVAINIFDRVVPVELDLLQVEKI